MIFCGKMARIAQSQQLPLITFAEVCIVPAVKLNASCLSRCVGLGVNSYAKVDLKTHSLWSAAFKATIEIIKAPKKQKGYAVRSKAS